MMNTLPPARFEGIVIYPDPDGIFEVRYPLNWHKFDVTHQAGGILFSPYPDHEKVWVSVWKDKIKKPANANDIESIREGLDEGIQQLGQNIQVEHQSEDVIGNLLRYERIVIFQTDQGVCKRRHWLFYAHKYQINLLYQARFEEYQHWAGMAYYAFHTFRLPEHLWFATDPKKTTPKRRRSKLVK